MPDAAILAEGLVKASGSVCTLRGVDIAAPAGRVPGVRTLRGFDIAAPAGSVPGVRPADDSVWGAFARSAGPVAVLTPIAVAG